MAKRIDRIEQQWWVNIRQNELKIPRSLPLFTCHQGIAEPHCAIPLKLAQISRRIPLLLAGSGSFSD